MKHRVSKNNAVKKKVQNRKHKTKAPLFEYAGVSYEVNVTGSGVYREMVGRIIEQLQTGLAIHGRLMVVRFDLHSYAFQADNKEIRAFRRRIMVWVERNYQTQHIGFVWVRERETTKHQHYHFALWIDGNKIQHPKKLLAHIKETWDAIDPNHYTYIPPNPFYKVGSIEDLKKPNEKHKRDKGVVHRLSYMAKTRGKGYRPEQVKDYSTSRLKIE